MSIYKGDRSEGARASNLLKERERRQQDAEKVRRQLEAETERSGLAIGSKFSTHSNAIEQQLKAKTYGLVTLDEMKAHRQTLDEQRALIEKKIEEERNAAAAAAKRKKQPPKAALSFQLDDDDDDDDDDDNDNNHPSSSVGFKKNKKANDSPENTDKDNDNNDNDNNGNINSATSSKTGSFFKKSKKMIMKNPDVDTSFLPDKEREERERQERKRLQAEWLEQQENLKAERIQVTYSYWDGSGHRYNITMKKGDTIEKFLADGLLQIRKDFPELRATSADQLMYVKEDLIIPIHYSFYDFIITKARGKSGPLFSFDVHDDVRLAADHTVEKDESHAGKVMLRSWYERHKHIFPANRWESYDPEKKWDKYTISDKNKNNDE